MCTLTWVHTDEPGYRLWFNRDERLERGPELPPAVGELPGVRSIAPADSDAGGTWISVNDAGVTVALLNGYIESRGPAREAWTSRGQLVRSLFDLRRPQDLWRRLSPSGLVPYRPAVVVAVAPGTPAVIARWDGLDLILSGDAEAELPIASSSYAQDEVQRARRDLYHELVTDAGGPTPERIDAFQRWTPDEGPNAYSPCMRREDAATRSQCRIEVDARGVRFTHVPGPPDATEPSPAIKLARRRR